MGPGGASELGVNFLSKHIHSSTYSGEALCYCSGSSKLINPNYIYQIDAPEGHYMRINNNIILAENLLPLSTNALIQSFESSEKDWKESEFYVYPVALASYYNSSKWSKYISCRICIMYKL